MTGDIRARLANVGLGVWVIVSAFLWPEPAQTLNTVGSGMLIAAIAALSLIAEPLLHRPELSSGARAANVVMAMWLFWSTLLLPSTWGATVMNAILVSMAVTAFAFFPWWSVELDVDEPSPVLALHPI
jgi:hypothetical protein